MSSSWYANKLNKPNVNPSPTPPYTPPSPQPFNPVPQPQVPQQVPQQPTSPLPSSARASQRCPGCGSGNYGSVTLESKARCYDCGYPVVQSGSGLGTGVQGSGGSGPAQPSRQVSTANNFNPQGIIGHI